MKQMLKEYGSIMIATFVCVMLLRLWSTLPVSSNGNIKETAKSVIVAQTGYLLDSNWCEDALQEYHSKKVPEIYYKYSGRMLTDTFISLEECFYLSEGVVNTQVKVQRIMDMKGNEHTIKIQNGTKGFYFTEEGIYMIFLEITDKDGRTAEYIIEFAVCDI